VKKHLLRRGEKLSIKNSSRGQFREIKYVEQAVVVDISRMMFYWAKDMHDVKPHGHADSKYFNRDMNVYKSNSIICHHAKLTSTHFVNDLINVCYLNSPEVLLLNNIIYPFKLSLLNWTLRHGKVMKRKRDRLDLPGSECRRLCFGFTQGQASNSEDSEVAVSGGTRVPLPFLQRGKKKTELPSLDLFQNGLKSALSKLLTIMSQLTGGQDNKLRQQLFGSRLAKIFGDDCGFGLEFVEFFAEYNSTLDRHCDYQNGQVKGYNKLGSFSYIQEKGTRKYRMNVIIAGRLFCDHTMNNIGATNKSEESWKVEKAKSS
jgi:hypothetical protein